MRQNRFYWTCPNREFGPGANPSAGCKYWSWGDKASASQMAGIARNVSAANACVSILLAAVRLVSGAQASALCFAGGRGDEARTSAFSAGDRRHRGSDGACDEHGRDCEEARTSVNALALLLLLLRLIGVDLLLVVRFSLPLGGRFLPFASKVRMARSRGSTSTFGVPGAPKSQGLSEQVAGEGSDSAPAAPP